MKNYALIALIFYLVFPGAVFAQDEEVLVVKVGSKKFTESVVLGDIAALLVKDAGAIGIHVRELGGTRIVYAALLNGEIDIYAEYTGTITQEILASENIEGMEAMRSALNRRGVLMSKTLGFNDTYAIGMREEVAEQLGITKISDLNDHPDLKIGFTNEFMDRGDGWPSLRDSYNLQHRDVIGMDHDIAYQAIQHGSIQVMDMYSTDAEIKEYNLRALEDDYNHFPRYDAIFLYRADLVERAPAVVESLLRLEGQISESEMVAMNSRAKIDKVDAKKVAADFLKGKLDIDIEVHIESKSERLWKHTREHLYLVIISLAAAIVVSVPLGIMASKEPKAGQVILGMVGIIQTIPALALLVMLIKPMGSIGSPPAIVALFLYSLLPIVRNTYTGLQEIPVHIRESANALGLNPSALLMRVELPMASRMILAGIKTAAVINIGFATLGALIGAGGYGQPILTGIRLNDYGLILEGAIPAALLAIIAQVFFDLLDRVFVPKGLRIKAAE